MDWLGHRQDAIEAELARRHLGPQANPARMALFDLSSSWLEGSQCPLAAWGHSRDGKKGKAQIEYGLLTNPVGRPVAVRVFPGNTGDPAVFTAIVDVVRKKFALAQMVMVGDRGMITSARIAALNRREDGTPRPDAYGWITALRAPAIRKLMADDGPLQMSLFDGQDLAEITCDDFPGERLIACRNPVLAADRARTRSELLAATEKLLAPIIARVQAGKLTGAGPIGVEVGKVISKYKTGKHFTVTITQDSLTVTRKQDQIDAEAALDGFYVLRTLVPADELDAPGVVTAYKNLKYVERDSDPAKAVRPELKAGSRGEAVGDGAGVAGHDGRGVVDLVDEHCEGAGDAGRAGPVEVDCDRCGCVGDGAGQAADDGFAGDRAVFVVVAQVAVELAGQPVLGVVREQPRDHLQAAAAGAQQRDLGVGVDVIGGQLRRDRVAGGQGFAGGCGRPGAPTPACQ